jgi:hypothetical protein
LLAALSVADGVLAVNTLLSVPVLLPGHPLPRALIFMAPAEPLRMDPI